MRIVKAMNFFFHPTVFFLAAIFIIVISGRWRPLLQESNDPVGLLRGLAAGVVLYYGMLAVFCRGLSSAKRHFKAVRNSLMRAGPGAGRIVILAGRAVYEEAFWRGTLQVIFGNGIPAVIIVAIAFTLRHVYLYYGRRTLTVLLILEFFIFSVVLGVIYQLSNRIMVVIAIHYARNMLVVFGRILPEESDKFPLYSSDTT